MQKTCRVWGREVMPRVSETGKRPKGVFGQWVRIGCLSVIFGLSNAVFSDSRVQTELETTYERLLPRAVGGDPEVQNLLGYMFFNGEGVPSDYQMAHYWLHRSASLGNIHAQRNLIVFHSGVLKEVPTEYLNKEEARYWQSRLHTPSLPRDGERVKRGTTLPPGASRPFAEGEYVYQSFCGGCHGFNGISYYVHSPSFALGERMEKTDFELRESIANGLNAMPAWGSILSESQLDAVSTYVRNLANDFHAGIGDSIQETPNLYFRFVPYGEKPSYWKDLERRIKDLDE